MTTNGNDDDLIVDEVLRDVAKLRPEVNEALMARVLADARRAPTEMPHSPAPSRWNVLHDLLGGWPTMGGLAIAGVAGLWVGVAPPNSVENIVAGLFGTIDTVSLLDYEIETELEGLIDG